jgi:hypothetical protein
MHNFTSINTIHSHPQIKLQIKITINQVTTVSHGERERKKERKRKRKREGKKEKERNIVRLSERCTKGGGPKGCDRAMRRRRREAEARRGVTE